MGLNLTNLQRTSSPPANKLRGRAKQRGPWPLLVFDNFLSLKGGDAAAAAAEGDLIQRAIFWRAIKECTDSRREQKILRVAEGLFYL